MNKTVTITAKKLKSGGFTLAIVAMLLFASVLLSRNNDALPASADAKNGVAALYAIAYRDIGDERSLALLEKDIGTLRARGLDTILPCEIESLQKSAVILIFERVHNMDSLIRFIGKAGVKAVVAVDENTNESELEQLFAAEDRGAAAAALQIGVCSNAVELAEEIAEAALGFKLKYGKNCGVFVETTDKETAFACLKTGNAALPLYVFVYGNGVNTPLENGSFPHILTRIVKLPEWTTDEYFSDIAPFAAAPLSQGG